MLSVLEELRGTAGPRTTGNAEADVELAVALSELRLVKDDFEIERDARGVPPARPRGSRRSSRTCREAVRRGRGERWVEGVFGLHARHVGNAVGYDTIAAAGDHACTLHWIRNDGDLRPATCC